MGPPDRQEEVDLIHHLGLGSQVADFTSRTGYRNFVSSSPPSMDRSSGVVSTCFHFR